MRELTDFDRHHADWLFHRLFLRYYRQPDSEAKRTARRWMQLAIERFGWDDRIAFVNLLDRR